MNLFKRTTASVALVALVSSVFATGVSANVVDYTASANALAAKGVINKVENSADYRLMDTITRAEQAKVIANLAGVSPKTSCENKFADVSATTPNNWVCGYVEALLENGLVSANVNYNPNANVTKTEALKFALSAAGKEVSYGTDWQAAVVEFAVESGYVSTFSDYNTAATRGFVFSVAAAATTQEEEADDILSELDKLLGDDSDDETNMEEEDETPTYTGNGELEVTLSPTTAASATIPGGVNGFKVASYDVTAASEDITITQLTVKRTGLSDKDTLTSLAVFTKNGRASNSKNDNQENDTEAQLNLSDGGVVVKAGETRTLTIVVDVNTAAKAGQDEFALQLVDIVASSTMPSLAGVVGNTMRVGSVDAPKLTFSNGSNVSNPTLGETEADIFEFEIDGDNNEDVILKTITFEGSNNASDDLVNFKLFKGNKVIAETAYMNDDYLTFDLGEGISIDEDKNVDFTVRADIVEGAGDSISFGIDEALDVTAQSTKFGFGASVDISAATNFGTIKIEAGELSITEVEPDFDEIREDKNNVVIGGFMLNNVAGENLELQEFGVRIALNAGTAALPGNTGGTLTVQELFDDIELYNEETGSSYELQLNGADDKDAVFSDTSIDVVVPQGQTMWSVRADTAEDITDFDTASFVLSFTTGHVNATSGGFYVEETDDDTEVTDITPSQISFNTIDGSESGAKAALVPLADITVVRGAKDLAVLQFEIEAEESSSILVDEIIAKVNPTASFSGGNLPNQSISEAKLYVGSVSASNLLGQESGSNLGNDGTITFNDFDDVTIAANKTKTFIVTLSFVDGIDAVINGPYNTTLVSISAEDDDNDDVTVAANFTSARDITVGDFGVLTLAEDDNNDDNDDAKTILAGENETIFSVDVQSTNENMEVETVVFSVNSDLTTAITSASLYLDDTLIDTNNNSDITWSAGTGTITFEDLDTLVVEQMTSELKLVLNTETIGYQKVGATTKGIMVTKVALSDVKGESSGKDAANIDLDITTSSKATDIVPTVLTPSVTTTLNSSATPQFRLTSTVGNNTIDLSNSKANAVVTSVRLSTLGTTIAGTGTFKLSNLDNSSDTVTGTASGDLLTFDTTGFSNANNRTISGGGNETFKVTITGTAEGDTVTLLLLEDGVTYNVSGTATSTGLLINMDNELDLGSRSY